MELFFDTETSGLAKFKLPAEDSSQPHVIQLAGILSTPTRIYAEFNFLLNPAGLQLDWVLEEGAAKVHQITKEEISRGLNSTYSLAFFENLLPYARTLVAHNIKFDMIMLQALAYRAGNTTLLNTLERVPKFCTMLTTTGLCRLPGKFGYKWPKLEELHLHLFGEEFSGAHDALADIRATRKCYYELVKRGLV